MKNMNLLLVIALSLALSFVLYNRLQNNAVKIAPPPPFTPIDDDSLVIPDKEKEKVEEPKEQPKEQVSLDHAKSFAEALKMAKEHNRNIFLFFTADWCGYCRQMKNETLADNDVKQKLATEYVVFYVDTDRIRNLTRKFKISGIPVSMIIDTDEKVVGRIAGFVNKNEFISFLNKEAIKASLEERKTSAIEIPEEDQAE